METIVPSVNTTKEELQERVDYMANKALQLEQLAKICLLYTSPSPRD